MSTRDKIQTIYLHLRTKKSQNLLFESQVALKFEIWR